MHYLVCFGFTLLLSQIYEYLNSRTNRTNILCKIILFLIIIAPAILGGLRSIEVGTDNYNYNLVVQYCISHNLDDSLINAYESTGGTMEKPFILLIWLLTKVGGSFTLFAFVTSFIAFFFFVLGAVYQSNKNELSFTIQIMLYLFIYYCPLLNQVRQGIAMAIIYYGLRYAENRQLIKFILAVLCASMFHISALITFAIYPIFIYVDKRKSNRYPFGIVLVILFFVCVGPNLMQMLLEFFSQFGIREKSLHRYAVRIGNSDGYSFVLRYLVASLPQLVITTLFYRIISKEKKAVGYYIMCWLQFALIFLGSVIAPLGRLSYYFNYSEFVLIAYIEKGLSQKTSKAVFRIGVVIYCISYWVVYTVLNYNGFERPVYPYYFN